MVVKSFVFIIAIINTFFTYGQDNQSSLLPIEAVAPGIDQMEVGSFFSPAIESILYNPAIAKRHVSKNTVEAIGLHNGNQIHFSIHFRKAKLHGSWQSFFENNQVCDSGRLVNNLPDGVWKTWYSNGQLRTVRTYHAEKYNYIKADLRRNHPKDWRYLITRYAKQQNQNKTSLYFLPQYQTAFSLHYPLTMLQKIELNTAAAAANYFAPFKQCLHHGMFINYFENGIVKDSGNYINGLKHELWEETTADSSERAFGFYRHGIRRGDWKFYDASNRLIYTEYYDQYGRPSERHYFRQ